MESIALWHCRNVTAPPEHNRIRHGRKIVLIEDLVNTNSNVRAQIEGETNVVREMDSALNA